MNVKEKISGKPIKYWIVLVFLLGGLITASSFLYSIGAQFILCNSKTFLTDTYEKFSDSDLKLLKEGKLKTKFLKNKILNDYFIKIKLTENIQSIESFIREQSKEGLRLDKLLLETKLEHLETRIKSDQMLKVMLDKLESLYYQLHRFKDSYDFLSKGLFGIYGTPWKQASLDLKKQLTPLIPVSVRKAVFELEDLGRTYAVFDERDTEDLRLINKNILDVIKNKEAFIEATRSVIEDKKDILSRIEIIEQLQNSDKDFIYNHPITGIQSVDEAIAKYVKPYTLTINNLMIPSDFISTGVSIYSYSARTDRERAATTMAAAKEFIERYKVKSIKVYFQVFPEMESKIDANGHQFVVSSSYAPSIDWSETSQNYIWQVYNWFEMDRNSKILLNNFGA